MIRSVRHWNAVKSSLLAIVLHSVAACGVDDAVKKISQVVLDPQIEVGPAESRPAKVTLHLYASDNVNPNFIGEPAPIVVKVFGLRADHLFLNSDFFSLSMAPTRTLDGTLTEYLGEGQLLPDSYRQLGPFELPSGTTKLGVLAEYIDIDKARWRDTFPVDAVGSDSSYLGLVLQDEIRIVE